MTRKENAAKPRASYRFTSRPANGERSSATSPFGACTRPAQVAV